MRSASLRHSPLNSWEVLPEPDQSVRVIGHGDTQGCPDIRFESYVYSVMSVI